MKRSGFLPRILCLLRRAAPISGAALLVLILPAGPAVAEPLRFERTPHDYWERQPEDPYSRWWRATAGAAPVPVEDEKAALRRFLKELDVPESSQMLVFSATSLQRNIEPVNPRALYFNDEIYIGWVPGGRVEVAADDASLGPVFFIQSILRNGTLGEPERQVRCLNCHASADMGHVPSLLSSSVLPDRAGGSLDRFRPETRIGHETPLAERFGGWHITGDDARHTPRANLLGRWERGRLDTYPNPVGQRFALTNYLRGEHASPLLTQLIHEHQLGAVNHLTAALYRGRELTGSDRGPLTADETTELDELAARITRYFLFADEAPLPAGGIGDPGKFLPDFTRNKKADPRGRSLKDPDLRTRLFRYRCSYMIHTPLWRGLPAVIKDRVWLALGHALADPANPHGRHLPSEEKQAIREIITATCDDRPAWWR